MGGTALFVKRENSSARKLFSHAEAQEMTLGFNLRTWFVLAGANLHFVWEARHCGT